MIGLGTWKCHVDTMFFKGDAQINIFDNNGEYGFELDIPDMSVPDVQIKSITEDGNTLSAVANVDVLPGKDIEISLTFDGDTVNGMLKVPFLGKIKLKNGVRVA